MSAIERTPASLVIRHQPWLESFIGVLFLVGGAWPFLAGERVFGAGFMLAGAALLLLAANIETTRFDRATRRMTKRVKGVVRHSEITHAFDEITGVRVVQLPGSGNSPSPRYRTVLVLKSGGQVPVNAGYGAARAEKVRLAAEIREFLGLPQQSDAPPPGFGEMIDAMRGSK